MIFWELFHPLESLDSLDTLNSISVLDHMVVQATVVVPGQLGHGDVR